MNNSAKKGKKLGALGVKEQSELQDPPQMFQYVIFVSEFFSDFAWNKGVGDKIILDTNTR